MSAYHDIAPRDKVFHELAGLYSTEKQAENLARLVAARRADVPNDTELPIWDADAKFLAQDYAGAITLLEKCRSVMEKDHSHGQMWIDLFIRGLVRLKHFGPALKEAYALEPAGKNWFYIAIAQCAAGNVAKGTQGPLDTMLREDGDEFINELYTDAVDLRPALAGRDFADWRAKHPNSPATQPTTAPMTRPQQRGHQQSNRVPWASVIACPCFPSSDAAPWASEYACPWHPIAKPDTSTPHFFACRIRAAGQARESILDRYGPGA